MTLEKDVNVWYGAVLRGDKFMAVYEDPRIAQITECLAGANCGGCGYAGCADYAKAIVENVFFRLN